MVGLLSKTIFSHCMTTTAVCGSGAIQHRPLIDPSSYNQHQQFTAKNIPLALDWHTLKIPIVM